MMIQTAQCLGCAHYRRGSKVRGGSCEAYPQGIPHEIYSNKVRHDAPYPGDNGIMFDPAPVDPDAEFVFDETMLKE